MSSKLHRLSRYLRTDISYTYGIGFLLCLHFIALFSFLPPDELLDDDPLLGVDYPVHTYRVHVYRTALFTDGVPWGYDPAVSAGSTIDPEQDVGAKPMQVLGVLLPWLSAAQVVKWFLYLSILSLPVWILLACRSFGMSGEDRVWVLLAVLVPLWLVQRLFNMMKLGLLSFLTASYLSVFVLALFLVYVMRPSRRTYVGLCAAAAFTFLLHIVGPLIIIPALVGFALWPGLVSWPRRLLLALVPVAAFVINSFWAVPTWIARKTLPTHPDPSSALPPDVLHHMTIMSVSDLAARVTRPNYLLFIILGLSLGSYGVYVMHKRLGKAAAVAVGGTVTFGLLLTFFGSFVPGLVSLQPTRFVTPTVAFLSLPLGMAGAAFARGLKLPVVKTALAGAVVLTVSGAMLGRPGSLPLAQESDELHSFIRQNTQPDDRLLIQARDGYRVGHYETKLFPYMMGREVIGSNFPEVGDPPQFLRTMLLGREITQWDPRELEDAMIRWGVSWIFTRTQEADDLLERTLGRPDEELGPFLVFEVSQQPTRFLAGSGDLSAEINRIHLSDLSSDDDLVVLRYRYHPAWSSTDDTPIERIAVPEDPTGFIGLRNPPDSLTLEFRPLGMFDAKWSEPTVRQLVADQLRGEEQP